MRLSRLFTLLAAAGLLTTGPAWAQERGVIMAGVMFQPTTTTFTDATDFTYNLEPANFTGTYDVGDSIGADVGAVVRVWKALGAGLSVNTANRSSSAQFTGSLAHPFFFGRPRTAEAEILDLNRTEVGFHIAAAFMVPSSSKLKLMVFGGPSFFNTKQDVVDDLDINEVYPFDTVTIAEGTVTELSESLFGFHAGADVAWYFSDSIGVGGLIRFAQGKKEVAIGDGAAFDLEAGGLQASFGIRFRWF